MNTQRNWSMVAFLLSIFISAVTAKDMIVKINNLTVKTDPEYLISKVTLRDEFGLTVVDVDSNIVKDIGTNAYIESELFVKLPGETEFEGFMKGSRIEVCAFFANPKLNPLLELIFTALVKYGFAITSCPIIKNKFNIVGFRMDTASTPSFAPSGEYRMEIRMTRKTADDTYKELYTIDCDTTIEKD